MNLKTRRQYPVLLIIWVDVLYSWRICRWRCSMPKAAYHKIHDEAVLKRPWAWSMKRVVTGNRSNGLIRSSSSFGCTTYIVELDKRSDVVDKLGSRTKISATLAQGDVETVTARRFNNRTTNRKDTLNNGTTPFDVHCRAVSVRTRR